jgi:PAS domain S-box-containing protein
MNPPLPKNENERLDALRRYAILDTPDEAAFDRITRLASRIFKTPISVVSLVDEARQWFKSVQGLSTRETSRELSFCAHAIVEDAVMVVPDATRDPRFAQNRLVTGSPGIRFYAGAPLKVGEGFNFGALCVIDTAPREFSAEERQVLRDLAAMVADELELRHLVRENVRLATAIASLSSGVLITDPSLPDNPIIFANPGFSAMTGYATEEILGRNCRFLQGPESDPATVREIREAIAARRTFHGTLLNRRKDGTPFWNQLTISPVFDAEGRLINFVGIQVDDTARRVAEQALQESLDKLKKLEALRDSLTNMIIHDLRNPLSVTMSFLDLLKMSAAKKLGQGEIRHIEMAQRGTDTLNEMITSLLDVHRLESGEMPLNLERCDLAELVTSATAQSRALVGEKRLTLHFSPAPVFLRCDATIIRRVIANLVSNALKFTPKTGDVRVSVTSDATLARVSVTDTGPGIPREYHARIFEKFGQVEGRRQVHSTGLGLTFCKLAIEAHGGTISVESEPGKGSTFSFVLPLEQA